MPLEGNPLQSPIEQYPRCISRGRDVFEVGLHRKGGTSLIVSPGSYVVGFQYQYLPLQANHCAFQLARVLACARAVSQLLWPDKDREVWFSLGENHEKVDRFPDFLLRSLGGEQLCATFFAESRMRFGGPPTSTGNPGSFYINCETAHARRFGNAYRDRIPG
jgi:hypothetical protein